MKNNKLSTNTVILYNTRSRYTNRINFVREQRYNLSRNKRDSFIQSSFFIFYICVPYQLAIRHKDSDARARIATHQEQLNFITMATAKKKRNYTIHRLTPQSVIFMFALSKIKERKKCTKSWNHSILSYTLHAKVWIFVLKHCDPSFKPPSRIERKETKEKKMTNI